MTIKSLLTTTLLLGCSVSMLAQTGTSSDSSMKKPDSMGKQITMTGCVSEKDGKYILVNKTHPDGVELMSSEDFKPHVGHKISVMGMMESGAMSDFKVSSMKMVSEHCAMPEAMMKK